MHIPKMTDNAPPSPIINSTRNPNFNISADPKAPNRISDKLERRLAKYFRLPLFQNVVTSITIPPFERAVKDRLRQGGMAMSIVFNGKNEARGLLLRTGIYYRPT